MNLHRQLSRSSQVHSLEEIYVLMTRFYHVDLASWPLSSIHLFIYSFLCGGNLISETISGLEIYAVGLIFDVFLRINSLSLYNRDVKQTS